MQQLFLVSDNLIPILIIGLFLGAMVLSYLFSKEKRMLRELKKSQPVSIHRAKQNTYIKLVGKAIGGNNLLKAPISGRPCVYYNVLVEKKDDKSWHKYAAEEQAQDFFLEVGSESAIIKPGLTHFEFKTTWFTFDHKDESGWFNDAKPHLEQFLKKQGKESVSLLGFNKTLRYREGIIEPNETIAVKGIAEWKTLNEPIEGFNYSKILTLKGTANQKLIITDHPEAVKKERPKL